MGKIWFVVTAGVAGMLSIGCVDRRAALVERVQTASSFGERAVAIAKLRCFDRAAAGEQEVAADLLLERDAVTVGENFGMAIALCSADITRRVVLGDARYGTVYGGTSLSHYILDEGASLITAGEPHWAIQYRDGAYGYCNVGDRRPPPADHAVVLDPGDARVSILDAQVVRGLLQEADEDNAWLAFKRSTREEVRDYQRSESFSADEFGSWWLMHLDPSQSTQRIYLHSHRAHAASNPVPLRIQP